MGTVLKALMSASYGRPPDIVNATGLKPLRLDGTSGNQAGTAAVTDWH